MRIPPALRRTLFRLAIELGMYAVLVAAYMFLILHFFSGLLVNLFHNDRVMYAALALALMVFQGIFLESLTTFLIDRLEL